VQVSVLTGIQATEETADGVYCTEEKWQYGAQSNRTPAETGEVSRDSGAAEENLGVGA